MSNTYFLAPYLPPIQLGKKPKIEKGELEALLHSQLSESDFIQFQLLKSHFEEGNAHLPASKFLRAFFELENEIRGQFLPLRKREKSDLTPELFKKLYMKGPLSIEKGLIEYKLSKIDDMIGLDVFSVDAVLAYVAKFYLNEKMLKIEHERGEELLDRLEKEIL